MLKPPTYPPILDDLPSPEDRLGFEPYVLALSDILLDANTHTPLTLGLFGSWGSGKTSLMRMLRGRIDERPTEEREAFPIQTIWFNAWMYSREESLWRALLLHVLGGARDLLADNPKAHRELDRIAAQLTASAGPVSSPVLILPGEQVDVPGAQINLPLQAGLRVLQATAAASTGPAAANHAPLAALVDIVEAAEARVRQARIAALDDFRRTLEEVSRGYVRDRARLVVFVDDLDRCLPEKALEVLEALKLFLDVEGWVFVLALDAEAVENAIRRRYQGEVKAREYLEKIIQVPFILPPIEAESMRVYVQSLAPSLPDSRCTEVFAVGLGANPRQVKRILNIFLLLSRLVERRPELKDAIRPVRLAKIVAIQHAYPELYGRDGRPGEEGAVRPSLPEALAPFASRSDLERLFLCVADDDASFAGQKPEALRPYITLTRQAAPVEAPAVQVARLAFEPEIVAMPAGAFLMGTSPQQVEDMLKRFDWAQELKEDGVFVREHDQHPVTLGAYEIGRYPVLNVEYAEFVRTAGASAPPHWPGGSLPEELADHPVVNVTWRDALAYVQWLAERTGKPYRLPTEAEWEKAARGEDGRLWPWGNDWDAASANCQPAGPGRTTPRGQYSPAGDSPYGCADMAGNVWEWCSSSYRPYPYVIDDGRENLEEYEIRVLRGGSWHDDRTSVRCASRNGVTPVGRSGNLGFRVARDSLM